MSCDSEIIATSTILEAQPTLQVVAVSHSTPSWQEIHGQKIRTSIVRSPSKKPLVVTHHGITSNEPAVHDAQVYAFFADHYDYWTGRLGIKRSSWDWCHWGENLTLRTNPPIDERNLYIGDVWKFGHDSRGVLLQICGGRVPCSRLAWRCGQNESWLREVASTGFCGVYLRVVRGGTIQVGDEISVMQRRDRAVRVSAIAQTAFAKPSSQTHDMLRCLVEQPGLQNMNRTYFRRKLSLFEDTALEGSHSWKSWRPLRMNRTVEETVDTKSFYLEATDDQPLATYSPGQHLTVKLPTGAIRCWSISDWTNYANPPFYRLSIKKGGPVSTWMHEMGTAGTVLNVCSPAGVFKLDWTPMFPPRQVFISAGIGATPVFAMLEAHLAHNDMKNVPAVWIHVTRNSSTHLFRDHIPRTRNNLNRVVFFTSPTPGQDVQGSDYDHEGRPDYSFFHSLLKPHYLIDPMKITPIELEGRNSNFYICGPNTFEKDIRKFLSMCHVSNARIKGESFSPAPDGSHPGDDIEESIVNFTKSRREATWSRCEGRSILELAESIGVAPRYGCRVGACGVCMVKLVSGSVAGGLQLDGSNVLICIAKPADQRIEIDL